MTDFLISEETSCLSNRCGLISPYTDYVDGFCYFSCEYFFRCFGKNTTLSRSTITIKTISQYTLETLRHYKNTTIDWNIATRYKLESMMSTCIFMYICRKCIMLLQDHFWFTDTWYHKVSISLYSEDDTHCFLIACCEISEKVIVLLGDIWEICIFLTVLPSCWGYRLKKMVFYYTCDALSFRCDDTNDGDIRLRVEYVWPYRCIHIWMLITYDVRRYERCHGV